MLVGLGDLESGPHQGALKSIGTRVKRARQQDAGASQGFSRRIARALGAIIRVRKTIAPNEEHMLIGRHNHVRNPYLLGAHVSTAGGAHLAPERGRAIGATAIQVFTKSPHQWKDPHLKEWTSAEFRKSMQENNMRCVLGHDSYLINLASPDQVLSRRSVKALRAELARCDQLGIDRLVSHPGNYIDDQNRGLRRNATRLTRCLRESAPQIHVLLETTAGSGTALGACFEDLAELRDRVAADVRDRIGFCADTCHLFSAGYDLRNAYDKVWEDWERLIGLDGLQCLHLNDSATPFGSRRDRHALIAEGSLGPEPFQRVMCDPRFETIPKILETPKGPDNRNDIRMLRRLVRYAG